MNADLERQLSEMGPEYRAVAERLTRAATVEPSSVPGASRSVRRWAESIGIIGGEDGPTAVWIAWCPLRTAAAVAAVLLGVTAVFVLHHQRVAASAFAANVTPAQVPYTLAYVAGREAVDDILDGQRADGSWANDFLTRQNAAALRDVPTARTAYKRAVRYLKSKGLRPLTAEELRQRRASAEHFLARR